MENSERDGIPDHVTCLLRNLYSGHEVTVRSGHGTTDWFPIGTGEITETEAPIHRSNVKLDTAKKETKKKEKTTKKNSQKSK